MGITSLEDNETRAQILEKAINLKAIPVTWFSYPIDPLLIANLTSAGLKHFAPLTGVFYDLRQEQPYFLVSPHLKLSIAKDVTYFKDFLFIFEQTWNHPQGYGEFFFKNLLNSTRFIPFVLRHNDTPVGACVLDIQNEIAGCYWDCVLPAYRNQGIGRLMVQARLKLAQERGCKNVVAQCLPSSLNVYTNLGFQRACDMALFRYSNLA
ncbi:MAG: hypothetical protein BGO77_00045 [Caedibacter sp. 37-49]|nr:MAG: hypothetical protein BGO77_00045 [Caedibacter sp. 37-49]